MEEGNRLRQIIHKGGVWAAKRMAHSNFALPFVLLLQRQFNRDSTGTKAAVAAQSGAGKRYTLLALSTEKFRGDLDILERSGRFRVLRLPRAWQKGILGLFWEGQVEAAIKLRREYQSDDIPDWIKVRRTAARRFLCHLLRGLAARLNIDAAITATVWYPVDADWVFAAEQVGIPYIALHKENLLTEAGHRRYQRSQCEYLGRFIGSKIIVHNEIVRKIYVDSGFVGADRIAALGSLRMDEFVARVASPPPPKPKTRKSVVFFSFQRAPALWGIFEGFPEDPKGGMPVFFRDTHLCIARLAKQRPDLDFVIKPKYAGQWTEELNKVLSTAGLTPDSLPNLRIVPFVDDVTQMILNADVVCAFGSTTLLEAGITRIPVVMPLFAEAESEAYRDYVHFRDRDDLFEIARSPAEFEEKILRCVDSPDVDANRIEGCRAEFERYVSPLSGGARERYVDAIVDTIEAHRQRGQGTR